LELGIGVPFLFGLFFVANNALTFFNFGGGRLMRIARRFAVAMAALSVCLMATAANAGSFTLSQSADVANGVVVTYDPASGNVSYNGNGVLVSTMELKSAENLFIPAGVNEGVVTGAFDVMNAGKFFKLVTDGVPSVDVGAILPTGLSADAVLNGIQVDGSIKPSGKLTAAPGGGPYLYVVPEPSSLALVCCGLLGLLGLRRK
jgi:hypothetical protein